MKVDKRVREIKVYVDDKSREIQEKLFELGVKWIVGEVTVRFENNPFLFVNNHGLMTTSIDRNVFASKEFKEVKADEILSWELQSQPQLEPFQKVLVRQEDDEEWRVNFFSHYKQLSYTPIPRHVCMLKMWRQCIPYEGYEHLLGTKDNPNEKAQ